MASEVKSSPAVSHVAYPRDLAGLGKDASPVRPGKSHYRHKIKRLLKTRQDFLIDRRPRLIFDQDETAASNDSLPVPDRISGGELFERIIDEDFELSEREVIKYMLQIVDGVGFIHKQGIVHLDLKPENIMCVNKIGSKIKLIDFGLARRLGDLSPLRDFRRAPSQPRSRFLTPSDPSLCLPQKTPGPSKFCSERPSLWHPRSSTTKPSVTPPTCGASASSATFCEYRSRGEDPSWPEMVGHALSRSSGIRSAEYSAPCTRGGFAHTSKSEGIRASGSALG